MLKFGPPRSIAKLYVKVVIGVVIGKIAHGIMRKRGIKVIAGAQGDAEAAVPDFKG